MIRLKASDGSEAARKIKEAILLKALPQVFHKVNILLRLQNEFLLQRREGIETYANERFTVNMVTMVGFFSEIGLTKFSSLKNEIEVLVQRLLTGVVLKGDTEVFDQLVRAIKGSEAELL